MFHTLTPGPSPVPSPPSLTGRGEKDRFQSCFLAFLPLLPVREGGRGREKRAGVMRVYPSFRNPASPGNRAWA
jgi:hypothetical protein